MKKENVKISWVTFNHSFVWFIGLHFLVAFWHFSTTPLIRLLLSPFPFLPRLKLPPFGLEVAILRRTGYAFSLKTLIVGR